MPTSGEMDVTTNVLTAMAPSSESTESQPSEQAESKTLRKDPPGADGENYGEVHHGSVNDSRHETEISLGGTHLRISERAKS